MENFPLNARDGYPLSVSLFRPENSNAKLLLINSATGVKQEMYYSFAAYFASQGYTVITYDFRGIGMSKPPNLKGFKANMRMWGAVDFESVTDWLELEFLHYEKYCLGHSVGALIMGMNPQSTIFSKFIFIATQKAYFSNLNWKVKLSAALGFGLVQPILTHLFNFFPANYLGLGESLPSGCAFDWRSLVLHKDSTNFLLKSTIDISKQLQQPTLFLYAEDDKWVTMKGMQTLLADTYPNLKAQFSALKIEDSPRKKIGHVNFFRNYNKPLWEIPLNWLSQE
jgi:predicted alpha/beta hydrolase